MNLTVSIDPSCIKKLESTYVNSNVPKILVGDTVKIGVSITEGNKERIQFAQGVVIAKSNAGLNTTITVRKVMQGIGVERVYLVNSPKLKTIEVLRSSKIRRAKLYYLRDRSGKATRLKQSFK
jgi:large subunit ribosomal protein L19|tara:strand:+ start:20233 stop:20601 length:369 start_codon:yes stop_codon:yes gene_type:complete